jgi:hypothetical protein
MTTLESGMICQLQQATTTVNQGSHVDRMESLTEKPSGANELSICKLLKHAIQVGMCLAEESE